MLTIQLTWTGPCGVILGRSRRIGGAPKMKRLGKVFILHFFPACGGDGTIGWILSTMDALEFPRPRPAIGIIPLGTGNDLSRSLNWGGKYRCAIPDAELNRSNRNVLNIRDASIFVEVSLQRWNGRNCRQ